ncbi:MAG: hypothetical protein ABFQ95_06470 [Pseudomonadota bacterium]
MANYLRRILSIETPGLGRVITTILCIPYDDIPDVIGRTLTIYNTIGEDGAVDLVEYISQIPKERRDFIMEEAKRLYNKDMNAISKGHLIRGLSKIATEDFNDIVTLGRELFLDNTQGGHMSLILNNLEKSIKKDMRSDFVKQVKVLLKPTDTSMIRNNIICTLSKFSEEHRKIFLKLMPSSISTETTEKVFDSLHFITYIDIQFRENDKAEEQKLIGRFINYYQDNLARHEIVSEEKFLTTTLSAIQYAKMKLLYTAEDR